MMNPSKLDRFSIYDNIWVAFLFFFLPFNYALTLSIGFPLKISEVSLVVIFAFGFVFLGIRFIRLPSFQAIRVLVLFSVVVTVSVFINLFWQYDYPFKIFPVRLHHRFDSILKYFYFLIDIAVLFIAFNGFKANRKKYISWWLYGSVLAALYAWYLVFSSVFDYTPIFLPGMDLHPQTITLNFGKIIRCGTFKEGNYMGVYLLICFIVAKYDRRKRLSYFFLFSIFSTFSSVAIISLTLFLIIYTFKKNYTIKRFPLLLISLASFVLVAVFILKNDDMRLIVVKKITAETNEIHYNSYSKVDRLNSMLVSLKQALHNPIWGVGLGNYGLHYDHYNNHPYFTYFNFRPIPNNVYLEILCETGILGFILFITFLYLLYKASAYDRSGVLRIGLISLIICFVAFPTFSVIFIWVFFGLILSLKSDISDNEKLNSKS